MAIYSSKSVGFVQVGGFDIKGRIISLTLREQNVVRRNLNLGSILFCFRSTGST